VEHGFSEKSVLIAFVSNIFEAVLAMAKPYNCIFDFVVGNEEDKKYDSNYKLILIVPVVFNKYSLIFNLCLNIMDIKEGWGYILSNNYNESSYHLVFNETFNNYYYYGLSNYKNYNILEVYRIFISLLFKYYNNFLYKLSRYVYVLDMKDYTLFKFFKRYFNIKEFLSNIYIKFRLQLQPGYLFSKNIESKFYKKIICRKDKYAKKSRRIELAPF
jgi:hypothetical protein